MWFDSFEGEMVLPEHIEHLTSVDADDRNYNDEDSQKVRDSSNLEVMIVLVNL